MRAKIKAVIALLLIAELIVILVHIVSFIAEREFDLTNYLTAPLMAFVVVASAFVVYYLLMWVVEDIK